MTRAATYRLEGARLRESLEFWQVQLHLDPQNEVCKVAIKDGRARLQVLADRKELGRRVRLRTRWMESGDRMNKFCFPSVRDCPVAGGLIIELYNKDKTMVFSRKGPCWGLQFVLYSNLEPNGRYADYCVELLRRIHGKFSRVAQ